MMKRHCYPHTLSILLFMLNMACPCLPSWAIGVSPDSLLRMPIVERFNTMARLYHESGKVDSTLAREYVKELTLFFDKRGTKEDRLVFQVSLLPADKDNSKKESIFLKSVLPLLREAEANGNPFLIAKIHQCVAMFYYNTLHDYGPAFQHYFRMYDLIKNMDEATFPNRNYAIYLMARAYYDFSDYENAIRIGQILREVKPGFVQHAHIFNACVLGRSYLQLSSYDEARREFEWALEQLPVERVKHTAWAGILNGDIGLTLFEEKKYEKAVPYLQKGLSLCEQSQLWDNASRFSAKLARIELIRQEPQRAYKVAELTLTMARRIRDSVQPIGLYMTEPYQLMSDCSRALGRYMQAVLYADSAALASEQWHQVRDVAHKHKAEIAIELERHEAQQALLEKEKERQLLYRNGLLLLTLLGLVIAALLYNRQNLKDRHRQQQLLAEKQLAETELEHAVAQLQQLRQRNKLIAKVEKRWETQAANTLRDFARQQMLNELHHSVLLTEDAWRAFTNLLDKVYPGFQYRLKAKLPGLSPAETRFLTLQKLGYTHQEMAAMLGVGLGAIRQYRLRLRRKLNLADDGEIEQLVAKI
jgi:tetratricopeptide (TPR) repeat protein/DNA-binding CsgD family transcriptional regulator